MLKPPVAPMLAATAAALPEPGALRGGCLYQPKFDGYRALIFRDKDAVVIQSRNGNLLTRGFPEIVAAVLDQIPPGVVLDGELVVWDGHGINFTALAGRMGATRRADELARSRPATFLAFDVLAVEGADVRRLPLSERLDLLATLMADTSPPLQMVPTTGNVTTARAWLADYAATPSLGMEGVVVKGAADPYAPGKRGWLKYRVRQTYDVLVGAVVGSLEAPTRLVLGYHVEPADPGEGPGDTPNVTRGDGPDGPADPTSEALPPRLRVAGSSIPLGSRQARAIGALLQPALAEEHPWPAQMPARWLGDWATDTTRLRHVRPLLVVEVSADTAFEYGRWRHQVRYVRVRTDKDPTQVRRPDPPGPRAAG